MCDLYCTARIARRGKLREFCLLRHTRLMGNMLMNMNMSGELNPPSEMLRQFTDPTGEMRCLQIFSGSFIAPESNLLLFGKCAEQDYLQKNFANQKSTLQMSLLVSEQALPKLGGKISISLLFYSLYNKKHQHKLFYVISETVRILTFSCLPCIFRAEIQRRAKISQQHCKEAAAGGADTTGSRDRRFGLNGNSSCFFPQLIPLLQHFLILNIISLVAVGAESCSYVLR